MQGLTGSISVVSTPPSPGGAGRGVAVEEEEVEDEAPQLLRTRSDASFMEVLRRVKTHSNARDLQRLRTHRFSINGHFYNHKVITYLLPTCRRRALPPPVGGP